MAESKTKKKAGRPSKYDSINKEQVRFLVDKGCTDVEMAQFFGVSERTWHDWKREHPDFSQSLKDWKQHADERVERSLFERATGYKCKDTKFATHEGMITDEREYIKHYPPDVTACIFWLKNRQPENWREKVEPTGSAEGEIEGFEVVEYEEDQGEGEQAASGPG